MISAATTITPFAHSADGCRCGLVSTGAALGLAEATAAGGVARHKQRAQRRCRSDDEAHHGGDVGPVHRPRVVGDFVLVQAGRAHKRHGDHQHGEAEREA